MSLTLVLAIWGAVTGTGGTLVSLASRRDAVWARRARARDSRGDVEAIRDVLAESRADPSRAATLTSNNNFRARIQAIEDARQRCPDRKIRAQLADVSARCLSLSNTAANSAPSISYSLTNAIETAMEATTAVLDRFDALDRRAPG
jgi:hypothetical protein